MPSLRILMCIYIQTYYYMTGLNPPWYSSQFTTRVYPHSETSSAVIQTPAKKSNWGKNTHDPQNEPDLDDV